MDRRQIEEAHVVEIMLSEQVNEWRGRVVRG
jgi:hypothetical protein